MDLSVKHYTPFRSISVWCHARQSSRTNTAWNSLSKHEVHMRGPFRLERTSAVIGRCVVMVTRPVRGKTRAQFLYISFFIFSFLFSSINSYVFWWLYFSPSFLWIFMYFLVLILSSPVNSHVFLCFNSSIIFSSIRS